MGRWRLSSWRLGLFWFGVALVPALGVYGAVIVLAQPLPAWWFLVVWFAILGLNGWQIARMTTGVDLEADGTVRLHRPLLGRVELRAEQVRRIRRGRFASKLNASNSPLRLEYGDDTGGRRTAPLAWGFPAVFDLATALREHNPALGVEDL